MHGYLYILFGATILMLISIYTEKDILLAKNMDRLLLYRYFHFYTFIYIAFFCLFFNVNDKVNVWIYLIFTLATMIHWRVFGCCLTSLFELNQYSLTYTIDTISTSDHPTIKSIFGENIPYAMLAFSIALLLNVYYLFRNTKVISSFNKKIFSIIFVVLFILGMTNKGTEFYDKKVIQQFKNF